ncbi:bifunctional DNA-formamidopyrimidine glycosylase/DNA-(apurinic or apyrimidinic site) lyase [Pseudarthrobacter sp. J1763]|uniref:bifunctional DNA-formamidopyrimidine glycosylase/DNA-(apurinic or apyrimidinic site) lyase n=1 Tax=Pseudarthrobacter sp. J1763 TaxID=3420445 RepID=UPI003D2CA9AD
MPELPEVEVVRRGLQRWVVGRTVENVDVLDPRSLRRHLLGDFSAELSGAVVTAAVRRGKFLWMPLSFPSLAIGESTTAPAAAAVAPAPSGLALVAHLGMSGQLLVEDSEAADEKHLKVRLNLSPRPGMPGELRFVDQRIFGGLALSPLVATADGGAGGRWQTEAAPLLPEVSDGVELFTHLIPEQAAHIARDPLDPEFDFELFFHRLKSKRTAIKRALLDQELISGIGNIYADEALWRAKMHYARASDSLTKKSAKTIVEAAREVMTEALDAGGTSFDSLYVNVNGASGYFSRSLNVYGRTGRPCDRCGAPVVREKFTNRSSHFCPMCQRKR